MARVREKDEDVLALKYVPLGTVARWKSNSKKHDIPTLVRSIQRHGFRDPLTFDANLNAGKGGIVEGNGRDEALKDMFAQSPKKPPRGITIQDNDWMVPVLFGVDAKSQAAAEAYGYDHNNITMAGGDFGLADMLAMYEEGTAKMLLGLQGDGELPVSVSAEDLDALLNAEREKLSEEEEGIREKNMLRVLISVPAALALDVMEYLETVKTFPGVEVDVSGN